MGVQVETNIPRQVHQRLLQERVGVEVDTAFGAQHRPDEFGRNTAYASRMPGASIFEKVPTYATQFSAPGSERSGGIGSLSPSNQNSP